MKLTTEQIEQIKSFSSVEELIKEVPDIDPEILKSLYNQYNSTDLSEEELENVTGGTCFSSGVKDPETGVVKKYAIVSPLNSCPLNALSTNYSTLCTSCPKHFIVGATWYCRDRWEGHNTAYLGFHPDAGPNCLYFIDDPQ